MKNEKIVHAFEVLRDAPLENDEVKADIWDEVYRAPNAEALAKRFEEAFPDIPEHIVAALLTAKPLLDTEHPAPSNVNRVKDAAKHMSQMHPQLLDVMEKHPNVLKHILGESPKKD